MPYQRGTDRHSARLTEDNVRAIRAAYAQRRANGRRIETTHTLARVHGVSHVTIANIVSGKSWKHVV